MKKHLEIKNTTIKKLRGRNKNENIQKQTRQLKKYLIWNHYRKIIDKIS